VTKGLLLDPRRGRPSASSMYRLKECSGAHALSAWVKANGYFVPTNPWAMAGTRIHQWLALQLFAQNSTERYAAFSKIDQSLHSDERTTTQQCADLRDEILSEWNPAWTGYDKNTGFKLIIEQRFWSELGKFSGQPDLIVIDELNERAIVLNYKTGRIEAEPAADNMQLRAEVVLLHEAYPTLKEIQAAIVEPLVDWESERVIYLPETLRQAREEILTILDSVRFRANVRRAGPWCVYCPGRVYCREALDYVERIPNFPALRTTDKLNTNGESRAEFNLEKMFRELPRGESGSILWRRLKFAEKLLEAIVQTYERILESEPGALPGFILPAEGKKRRRVINPAKLKTALVAYMTPEEVDGCADYSLAQIERHYKIKFDVSEARAKADIETATKDAISLTHDRPFIRPLTKKEREAEAAQGPALKQ
jgi:hypothetical protein